MKKIYTILLLFSLVTIYSFTYQNSFDRVGVDIQPKIVNFYPNPASSFINFEYSKTLEKGYSLQIYNFIGRKVYEAQVSGNKTTVTLDGYFRGIYIFQLRDKSGKIIESGKFQVVN